MMRLGAVGEVTGWAFDAKGQADQGRHQPPADQHSAERSGQGDHDRRRARPGQDPRDPRRADGRLINGLITDEATAHAIVA